MTRDDDAKLKSPAARPWLEFAVIMAIFFIAGGAPAPHVNETHYLLKAKHYWDPSYCPGDLFFDSTDAHVPFCWTVGWLTLWMPPAAAAWVGRLAAWVLLALGWMRLARAVVPVPWAAALSALVWIVLVDTCDFAGEWVVGGLVGKGGVEGKCFAYAFILFGLAALAAGRWTAPWVWFGAAAAMHPLVGGWAVLAGLGAWIAEPRASRPNTFALVPGLLLGGVLALPGLAPALALDRGASPEDSAKAARIYVFERLPHHLAPATLPADEFRRRSVRFGILVAAFAAIAVWLSKSQRKNETHEFNAHGVARIMRFATMTLLGNCIGLLIELLLADQPLTAARVLRYYWFRQADVIVPAATALAAACLAIDLTRRSWPYAKLAVALASLMCLAHLMHIAVDRVQNPAPPAVARMGNVDAWIDACEWIRDHAPPDAICLVPRHAQAFKWYAERADVVNWKDVPQNAVGVVEWFRRIKDIYPTIETPDGPTILGSPEQWGARRANSIARRYGADYIIARSEPPLGLREVFASGIDDPEGGYAIYIPDDAPASPAP